MTDGAFKAAIDAVSANGQIRWGVEHLYYEAARRYRRKKLPPAGCIWVCAAVALILIIVAIASSNITAVVVAVVAAVIGASLALKRGEKTASLKPEKFNEMWDRWVKVHGAQPGLIQRQAQPARARAVEPDLGDYSFDRAVICDRARTVDLLLANNFHFENNCAVLAIGGYPRGPFETVRAMLKRNPRLQVFILHDASVAGCKTGYHLVNDPDWFKGRPVSITDVGLRPVHARPFEGLLFPSDRGPVQPGEGIMTEEAEWLSKYTLELAAIKPEQVLKRLFRAINRKIVPEPEGYALATGISPPVYMDVEDEQARKRREFDFDFDIDSDSFGSEAGDSDGASDSFG
jgi:hypothetical protein